MQLHTSHERSTMNADIFAEWLRRQGHRVYKTTSSYWYDAGPRVLQAFPYHWQIQPEPAELRDLILKYSIFALRYSTPTSSPEGMISYHVVLNDLDYNMDKLRAQARNGIRRGLEKCIVERIPLQRLADEGWKLQQDTLDRQNRLSSMNQAEWQNICQAANDLPGFEAWGAIVDSALVASILTCRIDDKGYVPYAQSLRDYLPIHVNNALFYEATRDILSRPGISGIFFSLHSLDAPESVNEFKFRMGFVAQPVRQRVVLHPFLRPFINPVIHKIIKTNVLKNPYNSSLAKVEGMMRFYLQGKEPLNAQEWPPCMANYKKLHFENYPR